MTEKEKYNNFIKKLKLNCELDLLGSSTFRFYNPLVSKRITRRGKLEKEKIMEKIQEFLSKK